MSRKITVGIDIGTYQIKVVVAEELREQGRSVPKIIGCGFEESRGLRHGYILNQNDAARSLRKAIAQAEKASGVRIKRAYASIGGVGLHGTMVSGSVMVSRADKEITELDVDKSIMASKGEIPQSFIVNREIIHTIPIHYKVDGKSALGRPNGMKGLRLEAKTHFITCLEHHLRDLVEVIGEAGVETEDIVAAPIAASIVTLTKAQKVAGCVLANIGSETVSIVVYEDNLPVSLEVFPFGSNDITKDIALGLRIPLEEAESVKRGSVVGASYSRKKLEEIISARLSDIFELIEAHLKKIGRNGLLPAGIVLTGGGSGIPEIEELAKFSLRLPSRIGLIHPNLASRTEIKDASWAVAYGLCIIGLGEEGDDESPTGIRLAKKTKNDFVLWFRQFLP